MEWVAPYDVVRKSGFLSEALFLIFIVFFVFAFFNIVTAVFMDRVLKKAQPDTNELMLKKRQEDHDAALVLKDLIKNLDDGGDGIIATADIDKMGDDPQILDSLAIAGLNVT